MELAYSDGLGNVLTHAFHKEGGKNKRGDT
jgi:hypothetical protein